MTQGVLEGLLYNVHVQQTWMQTPTISRRPLARSLPTLQNDEDDDAPFSSGDAAAWPCLDHHPINSQITINPTTIYAIVRA